MAFHLAEIDLRSDPDLPPSALWDGVVAIETEQHLADFGYDDHVDTSVADRLSRLRIDEDHGHRWVLALRGDGGSGPVAATGDTTVTADDVLGAVSLEYALRDNLHLGAIDLVVRTSERHGGIGTALLAAAEQILRTEGRTTVIGWSIVTAALTDEASGLPDPAGTVRIQPDHTGVRFPLAHGYAFSQAERHSVQPLPVPVDVLSDALAEARQKAAEYEVVSFVGIPPEELLDGLAPLFAAMATDPPLGAVAWEEEVWDAERSRRAYARMALGNDVYSTVAWHRPTGELAAFTQLVGPKDRPHVVHQENTLVLGAHRGHALGLLAKAANCELLARERPGARRVHTWNADENGYMLAINTRLGYRRENISACWQKVLT